MLKVSCLNIDGRENASTESNTRCHNCVVVPTFTTMRIGYDFRFITKDNRADFEQFQYFFRKTFNESKDFPDVISVWNCSPSGYQCSKPYFVDQMNASLFQKIDGVLDLILDGKAIGWLVLFNINGRPKYCATAYNQMISDEVRHSLS